MQYGGATLADAVANVVMEWVPRIGGRGGLIAVDAHFGQ
ncbi:hypothetical protein LMG28688_07013 [Paraburkholderia caffeinitolerans]|uniref:Uncharacterized protein n=1 Tax=Paraburkholderia caffeinitolerans TaxID=1723730 RepID=A0A6J5H0L7_9BURK|nr:hypothetical protein LMG28688_07013 [Paraburkholderia caffeinitolerans]